jgi:hypothetical protein
MGNPLTGDYEAVLQFAGSSTDCSVRFTRMQRYKTPP